MPFFKQIKVLNPVTNPDSEQQETIQPRNYPLLAGFTAPFVGAPPSEWRYVFGSADDPEGRHEVSGTTLSKWAAEGKVEFVEYVPRPS